MKRPAFLTSKGEYFQLKTKLMGLVDVEKKIPEMVFKKQFERLYFIDFDWLYDAAILDVVRSLAADYYEQEYIVWAPKQERCYSDSFGYYPAFEKIANAAGLGVSSLAPLYEEGCNR